MQELFNELKIGTIINIEPVASSQNRVFKITTQDNEYLLKEYSNDAIKNKEDLELRIKQIEISKVLNNSSIPTIIPIEFNNNYFIEFKNKYYLIFNYLDYKVLTEEDLNNKYITILSSTLASLHKLNLQYNIPIQYKTINIDYEHYLNKFADKEYAKELYLILLKNKEKLTNLISVCNNTLPKINKNLCISHNDYKLKNILWNDYQIYLIDFDALALSNPIVSLAESAFALSRQNGVINYDFYKIYIQNYISVYGIINTNFEDALMCSMNGKLQWFEYLLTNSSEDNLKRVNECINMIKELVLFIDNKDKMLEIFNSI